MQARYVQLGDIVEYTPAGDVAAGDLVVANKLVGVATRPIPANTPGNIALAGVFEIVKDTATAFTLGALAYWDNTNKKAVTGDGGGANVLLGQVIAAAPAGTATVRIRLTN